LFIETNDFLYYSYENILCLRLLWGLLYRSLPNGLFLPNLYYLTIKTKEWDNKIKNYIKNRMTLSNRRAKNLITELNSIYSEIADYNQNYWSNYLFWVWILFATIINTQLYIGIFTNRNLILRFILIIGSFVFIFTLILIINSAPSVNFEVNRSYKMIYSLISKRRIIIWIYFQT
jgi:hypothetical protein